MEQHRSLYSAKQWFLQAGRRTHVCEKRSKMRDYMDGRVTPRKRVTSPTWGPPPPCKQALNLSQNFFDLDTYFSKRRVLRVSKRDLERENSTSVDRDWIFFLVKVLKYKASR